MEISFTKKGSAAEFEKLLFAINDNPKVKSIMILAGDKANITPENCDAILSKIKKPIWGGIFPSVIYEKNQFEEGIVLLGLESEAKVHLIEHISEDQYNFEDIIMSISAELPDFPTMSVVVDGFSQRINALIEALFLFFGLEQNYIGGGAGSLCMIQKPCIFSNSGLKADAAILAALPMQCGIGVQHGWKSISGPYKVTSSEKNIIKSIDFKPAFEVYKAIIDKHSGKQLNADNFFDIAKAYPFGISKIGAEKVVRDPISTSLNQLICVGEVQEGTFIDILHGNTQTLISAATIASERSTSGIIPSKRKFDLIFDCISRVLFLEAEFKKELNAIKTENIPLIGALSIGEIANNGKDYLEFYNKTAVIASFTG
jgi:hypothetical protein